jgi:hypothetical protein
MNNELVPTDRIAQAIFLLRGQKVMFDADLARIYGVSTVRLNEQLARNRKRFPDDFAFQVTRQEFVRLSQALGPNEGHGGRRKLPWMFTEHGAIMLASILNSNVAIEASVRVVRAFIHLREMLASNKQLAVKFAELERRLDANDNAIKTLFDAIRALLEPEQTESRHEIGFHVKEQARRYRTKTDI